MPFDYQSFLESHISFKGRNVTPAVRKICSLVRALIEKPKLLLLSEEALDFGSGIIYNFKELEKRLRNTTIISITHRNENIHAYNKIILMDGGTVIDKGEPKQLLSNSKSFLYVYLKETDKKALKQQLGKLGINQQDHTRFDSISRIQDLNGSMRETIGKAKEHTYSVFRQKEDSSKSPHSPLDSPVPPPVLKPAKGDDSSPLPKKKRTSSEPNARTKIAHESNDLLKQMCNDDTNAHHAPEMSNRQVGPRPSSRSIFGNARSYRPHEK